VTKTEYGSGKEKLSTRIARRTWEHRAEGGRSESRAGTGMESKGEDHCGSQHTGKGIRTGKGTARKTRTGGS
jgi:hypothetical protein